MGKFQKWLLRRISKAIVVQGFGHTRNIVEFYSVLISAAKNEFREDNAPTLSAFLIECHETALRINGLGK